MTDRDAIENLKNYIEILMEDYGYYKDIVEFRDSVEHLEKTIQTQQKEIEKKDKIVRSIISRLDNDIKNITDTKAKKREHYLDDYTRCRLKAYKTKTREIKEYIEKEYFAEK